MIKIKLKTKRRISHLAFSKSQVIIGGKGVDKADIFLSHLPENVHLKLYRDRKGFFLKKLLACHQVFLNNHIFEKKQIFQGDTIQIEDTQLIIEELDHPSSSYKMHKELKNETLYTSSKELLESRASAPLPHGAHFQKKGRLMVKEWISGGILLLILCALFLSVGTITYTTFQEKLEREEKRITGAFCDIAMGLFFAKVQKYKPDNLDYLEPGYLGSNIKTVLASRTFVDPHVDPNGHFNTLPYFLRFYTNKDFTHFVVIAQPRYSPLHLFLCRKTYVIDSNQMQVRVLHNVKALNQYLSSTLFNHELNRSRVAKLLGSAPTRSLAS